MEQRRISVAKLKSNSGQIDGVPANPREWTKEDVSKLAKSIEQTPELLEARGIIVYPHNGDYVVMGGNMRLAAIKQLGLKDAPCIVLPEDMSTDKLREIVIKDNGSFGKWDFDALGNEWDDLPLSDFGVDIPKEWSVDKLSLTTRDRDGNAEYDEFIKKFNEEQPLTTDNCYTPKEVYDLVLDFVDRRVCSLKGKRVVRPFYPGGDYREMTQYGKDSVVVDNPPFSIYAEIVRFYIEQNIPFFLFGPQLTLFVANADCCFCPFNVIITYENGAKVNTGFVTNMREGIRIWTESTLREAIQKVQASEATLAVLDLPKEVITSARIGKVAKWSGELEIKSEECRYVSNLEGLKAIGKGLFGGGFILSTEAAERAERAERAEAAERAELSERELAIVAALDNKT